MKKLVSAIVTIFAMVEMTAQSISGSWSGELVVNPSKRIAIVINIGRNDVGDPVCTVDSPYQGAEAIGANIDWLSSDSIAISVPKLNMNYSGTLHGDMIKGTFRQMGMSLRLDLTAGKPVFKRPQMPLPPFPYTTEEIVFTNSKDGAVLAGTLTIPADAERMAKRPVVLMVSGSGQQNRDEELFGHKPFLVMADYLARNGIASLRYDDRGTGKSTGETAQLTTAGIMNDAEAGMDYLRKLGDRFTHVGIAGHSEGATVAFMLAAREKADFIVSIAGPGVRGDTICANQTNAIMQHEGSKFRVTAEQMNRQAKAAGNKWLCFFVDYDPADDIAATRCPVMAVNGTKDMQVDAGLNLTAIKRYIGDRPGNVFRLYEGLNHLMQSCSTGFPDEYARIEETMSTEFLDDMTKWINGVCSGKGIDKRQ